MMPDTDTPDPDPDTPVVMPMPDPEPAACSLGGAGLECMTTAVAVVDPDEDGKFPEVTDLVGNGRPTGIGAVGKKVTRADDTADAPKFTASDMSAPSVGVKGWSGGLYERTMDKVATIVTVYTNQEAPGPLTYQEYYTNALQMDRDGITSIEDADTGNVLTFETSVSDLSKEMRFSSDMFPTGPSAVYTYKDDEPDTENVDESAGSDGRQEFDGMFHGIAGTYECTGTAGCRATNNKDGNLAYLDGTWTFTPKKATGKVAGVDPDADFMQFGYWVDATTDDEGDTTYGVSTFASGADVFSISAAQQLTGSAKYKGPAGGLYVLKTGPVENAVPTSSGRFTATANLTANFGQSATESIAPNALMSVSGTVTNFMDMSGDMIDSKWTTNLMKAGFAASGTNSLANPPGETDRSNAGEMFFGVTGGEGEWRGQFYGDSAGTAMPSGVAGQFNDHFVNGHVIGGFGATKVAE
jgi:hypothetical protein